MPLIISLSAFSAIIFRLYLSFNIYIPKFSFGFMNIYFFEIFSVFLIILLIFKKKLKILTNIERSYLLFIFLSFLTFLEGFLYTGVIDWKALFLILKFASFGLLIPVGYYLHKAFREQEIMRIFYLQAFFIIAVAGFIIYNMSTHPQSLNYMIGDYSPRYRLIGFTGYSLGLSGLKQIGHTSVSMGIYIAFIFFIFLSLYINNSNRRYLHCFIMVLLFCGELLTYSRAGILVIVCGLLILFIDRFLNKYVFYLFLVLLVFLLTLILYPSLQIYTKLFGTFSKLFIGHAGEGFWGGTIIIRIKYWLKALDFFRDNPLMILGGVGYGEQYANIITGIAFYESLIVTTLIQSGIFVLGVILAHFYYMWKYVNNDLKNNDSNFYSVILYGYKLFIPGFFIANCVAGNSLQTDFLAPIFYFILGVCIINIRKLTMAESYGKE